MIAPLRVVGGGVASMVEAEGTILDVACAATLHVVGDDEGEVLKVSIVAWVDVEVELSIPHRIVGDDVVLGEGSPKARGEVGVTDGVDILHHTLEFGHSVFVGVGSGNGVDPLLEPFGAVDFESLIFVAGHKTSREGCGRKACKEIFLYVVHREKSEKLEVKTQISRDW